MCKIICVTELSLCSDVKERFELLADSGIDAVVLRAKELSESEYLSLAKTALDIFAPKGVRVILHSFTKAALTLGTGSIHLPVSALGELDEDTKKRFDLIGASVHSVQEAKQAVSLGADYLIAGHVFETDCKKGQKGRGLGFLNDVCNSVDVPVYAIGGISPANCGRTIRAGAAGFCIRGAFMTAKEPSALAGRLRAGIRLSSDDLKLYAITDNGCFGSRSMTDCVKAALKGGASVIQLRDKQADHKTLVKEAKELLAVCRQFGALLIVNDDWQAALEAGAHGAHVGAEDTSVSEIRKAAGSRFIIGATAKSIAQAQSAMQQGADYLGVGALFASPTKKNALPVSKEEFSRIAASVNIPCVAIGGISRDNIASIQNIGAAGFAVVSAAFKGEDIEQNCKVLLGLIK